MMKKNYFFMFFCLLIFSFSNEKALAQCTFTINPSPASVCIGQSITLSASGGISYTWSANAGGGISSSVAVSPIANTIYTVTASTGTCTATQTVMVTVNSLPPVAATSTAVCAGGTGTLTASGATSYIWSTGTVGNTLVQTPAATTVYSVTGTSAAGCTKTVTGTLTVNPLPVITVNSPSTCIGSSATLNATVTTGSATFSWNTGALGASVTMSPTVTTNYAVTATSLFGCVNTATTTITVNPLPTVTVNSNTVCANTTSTLTASGAATYSWNTGPTTNSITPAPSITTNYTVTGTSALGCKDVQVATVVALANPTVVATSTTICSKTSTTLTASGASTYTWSANLGSVTTSTVAVAPTTTSVFTVSGTDAATGCKDSTVVTVTVLTNTLDITPPIGTTTLYCTGVPYQFGAVDTTTAGTSVQYYQWNCSPSLGVVMTNTACTICNGPTITFSTTGSYTLSVIVNLSSGCIDTAYFPLAVVQTPTVSIVNPPPITICQGGTGQIIYVQGNPSTGAPFTYAWTPQINIATQYAAGDSILLNPSNTGVYNYTVVGTNAQGCPSQPVVMTTTVNAPPQVNAYSGIYPSIRVDSICAYGSTSVHADLSYPVVGTTYTWTSGSAGTGNLGTPFASSSAVTPNYSGNMDTTFTYYVNLNVPGCPAYPTYTVYVVVVPTPTVYVASDTVENCNKKGDTLKVTSNPSYGVNFNWYPSYGLSTTTGPVVFANPLSALNITKTYYVTPNITVGGNVCIGKTDSIKVLIGDTADAQIDPRYWIDCRGMIDTLTAFPTRTVLNNTYQYYWTIPAIATGTVVSATGDQIAVTPVAIGIYTLTVNGTCIRKHTTEVLIAVNNCLQPIPSFSMTADTICRRHCITYTDFTLQNSSTMKPLFYRWTFTVLPPQSSISCIGQGCIIHQDTVWYEASDSSALPQIKVCYYINSALNTGGVFPVKEFVSHGPTFPVLKDSVIHSVTVYDGPLANAGHSPTITLGDAASLSGQLSSGTLATIQSYSWSPPIELSCNVCMNTAASPSVTTHYVLTVTDHNGCTDTSNITVFVDQVCFEPFIPSGFSPNGDLTNDTLFVRSNCLTDFTFKVYDRWGEKVFESADLKLGWDGKYRGSPMNAAVFVYTLEGVLSNGKSVNQKGNVTLVK